MTGDPRGAAPTRIARLFTAVGWLLRAGAGLAASSQSPGDLPIDGVLPQWGSGGET